jgi:hypothetical protein
MKKSKLVAIIKEVKQELDDIINISKLPELKKQAKKQYELSQVWSKLPKMKKLKTLPPQPAVYGTDFVLSYKSNGIKLHKGYLLLNLKTKTETYV